MTSLDASIAIIVALITIVGGLASYIFINSQKNVNDRFRAADDRFKHTEALIEQMVVNNNKLSSIIQDQDYRLTTVEKKIRIKK